MKAQNTTPMMTPTWSHRSAIVLAALIALVVIGLGLLYAPRFFSRTPVGNTVRPIAQSFITNCRVCRDEALGAAQFSLPAAPQARAAAPAVPAARPLIASCRVCRDEALAAAQVSPLAVRPMRASPPAIPAARQLIASCRVCRDEALGASSPSLTTIDFSERNAPPVVLHQSGPR